MPTMKLTARSVAAIQPSGQQRLYWDTAVRGLGVLVSASTDVKTYVVKGAVNSRVVRRKLGRTTWIGVDDARRLARQALLTFHSGTDPRAERKRKDLTLRQALEAYLGNPNLAPKSVELYRNAIEHHITAWLDTKLRDITRDEVEQRHRAIATEVKTKHNTTGHATANLVMKTLRAIFEMAADKDDTLQRNPARLRRQWFVIPRRERHVSADAMPKFYAAVMTLPDQDQRDLVLLLLHTGMRFQEAAGLQWDEIDFRARLLRLPAKRTKARRKLDLPLTTFVLDLLVARRGRALNGGEHVFPSHGRSGHLEAVRGAFDHVAAKTKMRLSPHDLRRTFVTIAESTDISPLALKCLVNHSSGMGITGDYVVTAPERLRAPAQKVCDRILELCAP